MVKYYNGEMCIIPKEFEEETRADERKKFVEELTLAMSKSPFLDDKVREVKIWIANQQTEGRKP